LLTHLNISDSRLEEKG